GPSALHHQAHFRAPPARMWAFVAGTRRCLEDLGECAPRILREPERQLAAGLDDGSAHVAAVLRQPRDQRLTALARGFRAALGRDELLRAARLLRQGAQFGGRERLADQVPLFHLLLLLREKLPRFLAPHSAGLAVEADHGERL